MSQSGTSTRHVMQNATHWAINKEMDHSNASAYKDVRHDDCIKCMGKTQFPINPHTQPVANSPLENYYDMLVEDDNKEEDDVTVMMSNITNSIKNESAGNAAATNNGLSV